MHGLEVHCGRMGLEHAHQGVGHLLADPLLHREAPRVHAHQASELRDADDLFVGNVADEGRAVCLHYLINRLQPLPWGTPVLVSLNPLREPDERRVHSEFTLAHPVFDATAIAAQRRLQEIQGAGNVWFCGAWAHNGFHEDGLRSGQEAAAGLLAKLARRHRMPTGAST